MNFFTTEFFIQLLMALATSLAFAIIFRVGKRHLFLVGVCGTLTYAVYYTFLFFTSSLFVAAFVSSMVTSLFSEVFARLRHAPTVVFLLPSIIPTVPGGSLYRGMRDLVTHHTDGAIQNFSETLEVGIGIAGGIVAVSILYGIAIDKIAKHKKRIAEHRKK